MTTDPPIAPRPGRIAGLALIGVAAVATVIGVITLIGGNGEGEAGQGSQAPSATATATSGPDSGTGDSSSAAPTSATPSSEAAPSSSTQAAPTTTSTMAPTVVPTTAAPPAAPVAPAPSVKDQDVRVYNNSTEHGLAARAKSDLEAQGWHVVEAANYSQGIIAVTTVYFRPGTAEESAAATLAREFGIRAEPRFDGIKQSSPGLIMIVTNNYRGPSGTTDK